MDIQSVAARKHFHTSDVCILHLSASQTGLQIGHYSRLGCGLAACKHTRATSSDVLSCFVNNRNFCPCYLPICENYVIVNMHDFSLRQNLICNSERKKQKKNTRMSFFMSSSKPKTLFVFPHLWSLFIFRRKAKKIMICIHIHPGYRSDRRAHIRSCFFSRANTSAPRWRIVRNGWYWWARQAASWELICKEYRCKEKEKRQVGACDGWRGYTVDRWRENINS